MRSTQARRRWLLLSDIHFRAHDLDRIQRTARWIETLPQQHKITRIVICGDLLSSRTNQPAKVLSACYRFLSNLIDAAPRVDILLGNHDLAYRRDYTTTALDVLNIRRLSSFVELHSAVSSREWDGRRVLTLPFREEQTELTSAVSRLDPRDAAETVAFAHLAIHKAVTQRHVIRPSTGESSARPITHSGMTGPANFASLARTFTGHFHSHQTLVQPGETQPVDRLHGSVTYIGSPLQLTWSDLNDEQRGVVLLDPATLHHELLVNPHAVDFITAELNTVLGGEMDSDLVANKHVMLIGELTQFKYLTARDKLLALGARSVRDWSPTASMLHTKEQQAFHVLGASVPASDHNSSGIPLKGDDVTRLDSVVEGAGAQDTSNGIETADQEEPESEPAPTIRALDFAQQAREYVEALEVHPSLAARTGELTRIGIALLQFSGTDLEASSPSYRDIMQAAASAEPVQPSTAAVETCHDAQVKHVFVAQPRTLTVTNFLGVQETVTLSFNDISRGLAFVVGANGSGKSTIFEAMIWCQFGRCVRNGLAVNDVVNDVAGKQCSVTLEFENGYTISRYRKHKTHGNRVIVTLHGEEQTQLEQRDSRSTQAAIDELLGIDYTTYVRTVLLGHESAAGFLSSTALQRRELIESRLGLSKLSDLSNLTKQIIKDFDLEIGELQGQLEGVGQTIKHIEGRVADMTIQKKALQKEAKEAIAQLEKALKDQSKVQSEKEACVKEMLANQDAAKSALAALHEKADNARRNVDNMKIKAHTADVRLALDAEQSNARNNLYDAQRRLQNLKIAGAGIKAPYSLRWRIACSTQNTIVWLQRWLEDRTAGESSPSFNSLVVWFARSFLPTVNYLQTGFRAIVSAMSEAKQQADLEQLYRDISTGEQELLALEAAREHLAERVALRYGMDETTVLQITKDMTVEEARDTAKQHSAHGHRLSLLTAEINQAMQSQMRQESADYGRTDKLRERLSELGHNVIHLENSLANNKSQTATFAQLLRTEQLSILELQMKQATQEAQVGQLASSRELFAFWEAASSRRNSKANNSSTATTSFRSYVLSKSLNELNSLLSQILTLLYDDTRHIRGMTSGILGSLYAGDEDVEGMDTRTETRDGGVVLDKTLGINSALSYAKRSGGERKRIDLALFFALLHLSHSRSRHRARYLLVDEVFDMLDAAGQAVVLRWCRSSMARMAFVLVVTHSEHMVRESEGGDGCLQIRALMGDGGTVFDLDK